ncbi:uncharacterized protein LOC123295943 [Chrysoperla carnea]|uniref:uncharacterized protein LOC123295942 n=1 Tax=Chrysoperla carnea TaxID=189513 RepID=UPI001D0795E9|nr:uncharacterized protein LOC123295942 [Chrysoperla carnea]XP_044733340.1 uncharacterized protein LOC123295943 [Chrysoperla carnea]
MRSTVNKYNIDSDVEKQIVNIKKTIYELSQWTAMQEWSRALLSDMHKVTQLIDAIDTERNELDQQYHDKLIELNQLEEKYRIVNSHLSKKNKKDDNKYETLQKAHAELTRKNTALTDKLHKLEKLMHEYKQRIEQSEVR